MNIFTFFLLRFASKTQLPKFRRNFGAIHGSLLLNSAFFTEDTANI